MKITPLFNCNQLEFDQAKSRDIIFLKCKYCKTLYKKSKKNILSKYTERGTYPTYCSNVCQGKMRTANSWSIVSCTNCFKNFSKANSEIKKSINNFCSCSCSTSFNNKNKKYGIRRSKFEIQLEDTLNNLYPDLKVIYSSKTIIGSELDFYIPSLKLAFEIQGIFHYEPIFGQEKLDQIQKNDLEKIQRCNELGINLVHINISKLKKCTVKNVTEYNKNIITIIEQCLKNN